METITLLDTAQGSTNKGDEIIMRCVEEEFHDLLSKHFVLKTPTHLVGNSFLQSIGRLPDSANAIYNSKYKFICGTNLLSDNMMHRSNQWNIDIFNCKYIHNSILVGVGSIVSKENYKLNWYTKKLYKNVLSREFVHSVRDDSAVSLLQQAGIKAVNTGCVTTWKLNEEFCSTIPIHKNSTDCIFTLTDYNRDIKKDIKMVQYIKSNYDRIYFWCQGIYDLDYLKSLMPIDNINIIPPSVDEYESILNNGQVDYIGTRLHAGIFALRHKCRSIIISIDERMSNIQKTFGGNVFLQRSNIDDLPDRINGKVVTNVSLREDMIKKFKSQFK